MTDPHLGPPDLGLSSSGGAPAPPTVGGPASNGGRRSQSAQRPSSVIAGLHQATPVSHPPIYRSLHPIYPSPAPSARYAHLLDVFAAKFHGQPDFLVRAPGRVAIIGDHTEEAGFPTLQAALGRDVVLAVKVIRPTTTTEAAAASAGGVANANSTTAAATTTTASGVDDEDKLIQVKHVAPETYRSATFSTVDQHRRRRRRPDSAAAAAPTATVDSTPATAPSRSSHSRQSKSTNDKGDHPHQEDDDADEDGGDPQDDDHEEDDDEEDAEAASMFRSIFALPSTPSRPDEDAAASSRPSTTSAGAGAGGGATSPVRARATTMGERLWAQYVQAGIAAVWNEEKRRAAAAATTMMALHGAQPIDTAPPALVALTFPGLQILVEGTLTPTAGLGSSSALIVAAAIAAAQAMRVQPPHHQQPPPGKVADCLATYSKAQLATLCTEAERALMHHTERVSGTSTSGSVRVSDAAVILLGQRGTALLVEPAPTSSNEASLLHIEAPPSSSSSSAPVRLSSHATLTPVPLLHNLLFLVCHSGSSHRTSSAVTAAFTPAAAVSSSSFSSSPSSVTPTLLDKRLAESTLAAHVLARALKVEMYAGDYWRKKHQERRRVAAAAANANGTNHHIDGRASPTSVPAESDALPPSSSSSASPEDRAAAGPAEMPRLTLADVWHASGFTLAQMVAWVRSAIKTRKKKTTMTTKTKTTTASNSTTTNEVDGSEDDDEEKGREEEKTSATSEAKPPAPPTAAGALAAPPPPVAAAAAKKKLPPPALHAHPYTLTELQTLFRSSASSLRLLFPSASSSSSSSSSTPSANDASPSSVYAATGEVAYAARQKKAMLKRRAGRSGVGAGGGGGGGPAPKTRLAFGRTMKAAITPEEEAPPANSLDEEDDLEEDAPPARHVVKMVAFGSTLVSSHPSSSPSWSSASSAGGAAVGLKARDAPFPWESESILESTAAYRPAGRPAGQSAYEASIAQANGAGFPSSSSLSSSTGVGGLVEPYRSQGDSTLYNPESLATREALRKSPLVAKEITRFWVLLPHTPAGDLAKEEYLLFFLRLCKLFNPDLGFDESWTLVQADWERDLARSNATKVTLTNPAGASTIVATATSLHPSGHLPVPPPLASRSSSTRSLMLTPRTTKGRQLAGTSGGASASVQQHQPPQTQALSPQQQDSSITYSTFCASLFELVDLWCPDVSATAYAALLEQVFSKLSVRVESKGGGGPANGPGMPRALKTNGASRVQSPFGRQLSGVSIHQHPQQEEEDSEDAEPTFDLYARALHVFSEALRVEQFLQLCTRARSAVDSSAGTGLTSEATAQVIASVTLEHLGSLMNASHVSLAHQYECSTEDLDTLVNICVQKAGALGARVTGVGWGGSVVALFDTSTFPGVSGAPSIAAGVAAHQRAVDHILDTVISEYYVGHLGMDREPQRDNFADMLFATEAGAAGAAIYMP